MPHADATDLPVIRELLAAHRLPTADLDDAAADIRFLAVRENGRPVGAIAVQVLGQRGLLRSLVVAPTHRGRGFARRLVAEAERVALQAGVRELVLLTETAAPFFSRLGYRPAVRESMPTDVQSTAEFASLCPSSAVCLAKPLRLAIYHNPACGTSRNALALMREASLEPEVIEYLRTPPDRATLLDLLNRMSLTPRDLLREKGTPYAELGFDDASLSDDALVSHMLETPLLINRPIVDAPWGVRLCRPSEAAREFLLLE